MNFNSYVNHPDPVVAETAQQLQKIADAYQQKQMSQQEYDELCADVLNFERVIQLTNDVNRQTEIYQAFQQLLQIVSVIKTLV